MDFSFFRHVSFLLSLEVGCYIISGQEELTQDYKSKYFKQSLSEQATLSVGNHWSMLSTSRKKLILFFLQKTLQFSHLKFSLNTKLLFRYPSVKIIWILA